MSHSAAAPAATQTAMGGWRADGRAATAAGDVPDAFWKSLGLFNLSRMVLAGETVQLDGAMPLRVKIGNAAATDVVFRGQALSLAPFTRDNVARLELK